MSTSHWEQYSIAAVKFWFEATGMPGFVVIPNSLFLVHYRFHSIRPPNQFQHQEKEESYTNSSRNTRISQIWNFIMKYGKIISLTSGNSLLAEVNMNLTSTNYATAWPWIWTSPQPTTLPRAPEYEPHLNQLRYRVPLNMNLTSTNYATACPWIWTSPQPTTLRRAPEYEPHLNQLRYCVLLNMNLTTNKMTMKLTKINSVLMLTAGIMDSNPTRGMDVCIVCVYSVIVLFCVWVKSLRLADPPFKGSYQLYIGSRNWKRGQDPTKSCRPIIQFNSICVYLRAILTAQRPITKSARVHRNKQKN
jgi:hypothetical protein